MIGRSGSGKTKAFYKALIEHELSGSSKTVLLIVPEQFTLQAERELISFGELQGLLNIQVISFRKLVDYALESGVTSQYVYLDDLGRHMLIKRILIENVAALKAFQTAHMKSGFVKMLGDFLAELNRSGIGARQLKEVADALPPLTAAKLSDIAMVSGKFEEIKAGHLMDEEDRFEMAMTQLSGLGLVKGATLYIDGFSGFTGQEFKMIEELAHVAELNIALTLDPERLNDPGIFLATAETYRRLEESSRKNGCAFSAIHKTYAHLKGNSLNHLEQNLFEFPPTEFVGSAEGLHIASFDSTWEEAEYTALEISTLMSEKACHFRDIAVVSNAPGVYDDVLKRVFRQYGLPFFHDDRRDIAGSPLARLMLSMLEAYQKGFQTEPLFRALKTGLLGLERQEWAQLEIIAIEKGIRGNRWEKPFEDVALERFRAKLWEEIKCFSALFSLADTARSYSESLYKWLSEAGVKSRYEARLEKLKSTEGFETVYEMSQGWNMVADLLDQIVAVSSEEKLKLGEYRAILETGFSAYETGVLPLDYDTVMIGRIEHSRSHPIRFLFVLGAADGLLPSNRDGSGLLTDDEKVSLKDHSLALKSTGEYLAMNEALSIYLAFTKPSEALYLSYALSDSMGKTMRPSYLIERLQTIYPTLTAPHIRLDMLPLEKRVAGLNAALSPVTRHLRNYLDGTNLELTGAFDLRWAALYLYLEHSEETHERATRIKAAFEHKNRPPSIGKEAAAQLFGSPLTTSISRLERFSSCPFKHFVDFGLKPKRIKPYEVDLPEVGRLFHSSVESFALQALQSGLDSKLVTEAEIAIMMGGIVDHEVEKSGKSVYDSTARNRYILRRVKRTGTRAAMTILDHLSQSHFSPKAFEVAFSARTEDSLPPILIELAGGERLLLEGRIDRIDLCETESGVAFVKIIDYKSGSETLDFTKIHHGLQLQLIAYMDAVLNDPSYLTSLPEVTAGGLFYFRIDDPMIDLENLDAADLERELLNKLKLDGLIVGGADVAKLLDMSLETDYKSARIPMDLKKDGTPTASSRTITADNFDCLRHYVRKKISDIGTSILNGEIDVLPYRFGQKTACEHCDLMGLCQFDLTYGDNQFRNLKKINSTEWLQALEMEDKRHG